MSSYIASAGTCKTPSSDLPRVLAAMIVVLAGPGALRAGSVAATFKCGSRDAGAMQVTYSDGIQFFSAPFQAIGGAWTASWGMTIDALAVPDAPFDGGHYAWMQAVTTYQAPRVIFTDVNSMILTDPFPDTPPGGYIVTSLAEAGPPQPQPFDDEPWYGNNQIGQLSLYDQPKVLAPALVTFETWLVCVTNFVHGIYDVIPLMGFTWGFSANYGLDGPDAGNTIGDTLSEYIGTPIVGGLMQGGQPSAPFKTGYDKYFNIYYHENNDVNCQLCVPEPSSFALFVLGAMGCVAIGLGRRWSAGFPGGPLRRYPFSRPQMNADRFRGDSR